MERIVEARDASAGELETNEINAGVYAFDAAWLRRRIEALSPRLQRRAVPHGPRPLAREDGRIVSAVGFDDDGTLDGINDRSQLAAGGVGPARADQRGPHARRRDDARPVDCLHRLGASTIGEDVTLDPGVLLGRDVGRCGLPDRTGTTIVDSTIGRDVAVRRSVVEQSTVEDGAFIGPYAHLRPGSHIGPGAEVGNFAEVKNSRLGARVKQHHMSYLGDADLGDGTNVGAGTITANWDGHQEPDHRRQERVPGRGHDARRPLWRSARVRGRARAPW